jgi:MOSC domain-containing protein YiiM
MDRESVVQSLRASLPQQGRVEQVLLAPKKRLPLVAVDHTEVCVGTGLAGDHHSERRPGGKRQVTLIQAEHLPVIAALSGHAELDAALLRRNIVVSGIPVTALRGARFTLGSAVLEGTGLCDPCARMEAVLGPGGYSAMRMMGGITARVVEPGTVRVGDALRFVALVD